MTQQPASLFRQEVLMARADTSSGPALHIRPVAARALTAFMLLLCALVLSVLGLGSYTKKEHVLGVVQARDGLANVVPPEAGVITRLLVREGQRVRAGEVLAEVGHDRFSDEGPTQALLEDKLQSQQQQVQAQAQGQAQAHEAELAAVAQRIAQAQSDQASLREEARLQNQQMDSTRRLLDQMRPLRDEHIVSDLQFEQQRQTLLDQNARLQALQRQLHAATADMARARDERDRLAAQHRVNQAGLDRDLLALQQERVQRHGARLSLIKAPMAGTVSGLTVSAGQSIAAGGLMATIVPSQSPMEALLYVPSTAIGFIHQGQAVRVSYDAFPYQRFGQYRGRVQSVSQSDVPLKAEGGQTDRRAYFLVRVALERPSVRAYGQDIALRPGHTLSADIEIDRRRLLSWLLDPLLAFTGRL